MSGAAGGSGALDAEAAWRLLRAVDAESRAKVLPRCFGLGFSEGGQPTVLETKNRHVRICADNESWTARGGIHDAAAQLFDLHLPLIRAGARGPVTIAQLGQSLDGRIATASGHSHYVTGDANRDHLHRLRALVDAVVVGAGTVEADDPQLTVRQASGANPIRVVIDPRGRLSDRFKVFRDGAAPTVLLCRADADADADVDGTQTHGQAEVWRLPIAGDGFDPARILHTLQARGLTRVLIEGGGVTVSRFLAAGLLDRLHLGVAPLLMGSGRPGITLPPIEDLAHAIRPKVRVFSMGADTLFDCDLRPG